MYGGRGGGPFGGHRGGPPRARGFNPRGRGGGRGGGFKKSAPDEPRISSTVQIFIEGLPLDAKVPEVAKFFSSVGPIKVDRLTKQPRVWLYHDKQTHQPTGECTITYTDPQSQQSALQTFDGQLYEGRPLKVTPSIVKPHMAKPPPPGQNNRGGGRGGPFRGRGRPFRGRGPPRGGGAHFGHNSNMEQIGPPRRGHHHSGGGPVMAMRGRGFGQPRFQPY